MFDGIVFAITDLGFVARSAREEDDGGEFRLAKIQRIIEQCRYGVHDISAVTLDSTHSLPRFNMPLELGLFLGCKRYGSNRQRYKVSLIFDRDPYRYQVFISDIAGQDIHPHNNDVKTAIRELRTWLATASERTKLPGGKDIFDAPFPTAAAPDSTHTHPTDLSKKPPMCQSIAPAVMQCPPLCSSFRQVSDTSGLKEPPETSASLLAESPISSNSSPRISPGCMGVRAMVLS